MTWLMLLLDVERVERQQLRVQLDGLGVDQVEVGRDHRLRGRRVALLYNLQALVQVILKKIKSMNSLMF